MFKVLLRSPNFSAILVRSATIAMKCDEMSGGFESEDLRISYKQRLCCFRRNFEISGDITLKLH